MQVDSLFWFYFVSYSIYNQIKQTKQDFNEHKSFNKGALSNFGSLNIGILAKTANEHKQFMIFFVSFECLQATSVTYFFRAMYIKS